MTEELEWVERMNQRGVCDVHNGTAHRRDEKFCKNWKALDEAGDRTRMEDPPSASAPRFHWRDGWTFKRGADGTVVVRHENKDTHRPDAEIFIPPNEWASIVASVCAANENAETYNLATRLHADSYARPCCDLHGRSCEDEANCCRACPNAKAVPSA